MTSNSEVNLASKSSFQQNLPKIWVQPDDNITFVCSKNQTVGIIKIHLQTFAKKTYEFQIKTTNKHNYKVSEPNGIINKCPYTIYIYLRQVNSLQHTLSDKFKVSVFDKKKMKTIHSAKYGVIIQSNLHSAKDEVLSDSNTTSKGVSIYTNPSILGESNSVKKSSLSVLRMSHIDSHLSTKKEKVILPNEEQNKSLRQRLNQSILVLQKSKRKQAHLEKQIKNKSAKQRFTIYIFIFILIASFFIGIYGKQFFQFKEKEPVSQESKFFYFF